EVVDVAVVAAGVHPGLVTDQAHDPVGQLELAQDVAGVVEGEDLAGLVAGPAVGVVHEDAERHVPRGELPQDGGRLLLRGPAADGPAGDGPLLADAHHGGLVALAQLLPDLPGGVLPGLRLRRVGPRAGLAGVADAAAA